MCTSEPRKVLAGEVTIHMGEYREDDIDFVAIRARIVGKKDAEQHVIYPSIWQKHGKDILGNLIDSLIHP